MDCFVAEFIIGPAEAGTRWLLTMTNTSYRATPTASLDRLKAEVEAYRVDGVEQ